MSYKHLTTRERSQLEVLYQLGWSARAKREAFGHWELDTRVVKAINRVESPQLGFGVYKITKAR
ncbi:hypothetical protein ASF12_00535 [Paenibacillus sp. Leaf72]|nr:hypothetical protein ASF12_00535 [Paenibacillus sp. Leaf72]